MKKAMQTALLLGLALLAGCAAPGAVSPAPTPELTESPEAGATGPVDSAPWFGGLRRGDRGAGAGGQRWDVR